MIKKFLPILFIVFIWFVFSKPFFLDRKTPFPSALQVNHFTFWREYPEFWGPVKNASQPDVISQIMPWKHLSIDTLKNLQIPFWNPYSFSGTPHLANYQSSPFSITNLFYAFFNFINAWSLTVLIQPLFAGYFMYLFIRSLGKSEVASLTASISFMFCGFITVWMSYTTLPLAIAFLPLSLYGVEKYYSNKKDRYLLLLSTTIPLSFFSGHFQTSLYFLIFIYAYIFFKFFENRNLKELIKVSLFVLFGLLISLPQILPSMELYAQALRSSIFEKVEAIPLKYLSVLISPDFYGNPVTGNNTSGYYAERSIFAGTIIFFLALYSIYKKVVYIFFFLLMTLLGILFSFDTPFASTLVGLHIPVISTSALGRAGVILSFSLSVLAAFGFDQLTIDLKQGKRRRIFSWIILSGFIMSILWLILLSHRIEPTIATIAIKNMILPSILIGLTLVLVFFTIFIKRLRYVLVFSLLILVSLDMLRFAVKWQPFDSKDLAFPNSPVISELKKLDNNYRFFGPFGAEGSVYYHLPVTDGYDALYINRYGEFIGSLTNSKLNSSFRSGVVFSAHAKYSPKVFNLLGIKYVLVKKGDIKKPWSFPFEKYPKQQFKLISSGNKFLIFENKYVYPRAFLLEDYKIITDNQEILSRMLDDKFDLRKSGVIEKDPKIKIDGEGTVDILNYSPNYVEIATNNKYPSILVLTDNYYPGWIAQVNDKESEVLRTDYTFRGVVIPAGKNKITFSYEPRSFKLGVIGAITGLIGIAFSLIFTKSGILRIWNKQPLPAQSAIRSNAKTVPGKRLTKRHFKSKKGK